MAQRPILYAHRGAPVERPENTLISFARALELGADALELDVHQTADGHVVVSHDPTGLRMAGVAREIRRSTLAEVRAWDAGWGFVDAAGRRPYARAGVTVPTLEEVLAAYPGVRLNVDLKQRAPSIVAPVVALVRRLGAEDRVLLTSFFTETLRQVRDTGYAGLTGLSRSEVVELMLLPLAALRMFPPAGSAAQVPYRFGVLNFGTAAMLAKCHALRLRVDYWTVNDPGVAETLLELGADGVMTDDPAAIAPVMEAFRAAD